MAEKIKKEERIAELYTSFCANSGCDRAIPSAAWGGSTQCGAREPNDVIEAFESDGCDNAQIRGVRGTLSRDGTFTPSES